MDQVILESISYNAYLGAMPIYEFACPKCRVIFNFLSRRIKPDRDPVCPKCGCKKMSKELSRFAFIKGGNDDGTGDDDLPDLDDPRVMQAMGEIERDLGSLDENNPRHVAQMMKRMREVMPDGSFPSELDTAIKRMENGESPEQIEADMGDVLENMMGEDGLLKKFSGTAEFYERDETLYDY